MRQKISVFWFRRDLRIFDNTGLYFALNSGFPVLPVFIFDNGILCKLNSKKDARVSFIHSEIIKLNSELLKSGSSVKVMHCMPLEAFVILTEEYEIESVFANSDYEPESMRRDKEIQDFLKGKGIAFYSFKDQVIFEQDEIVKDDGTPYTVFTPYSRKWKERYKNIEAKPHPSQDNLHKMLKTNPFRVPSLYELGFEESNIKVPDFDTSVQLINNYSETRDFPALGATSKLGAHLRFGTASIREVTRKAAELPEVFLNELVWRNFFSTILWHFPQVVDRAFKPKYDFIKWRNNENEFEAWRRGETGCRLSMPV